MDANTREYNTHANQCNDDERKLLNSLLQETVGAVYEVASELKSGFLEKVYERALIQELKTRGLEAEAQVPIQVFYKGEPIGNYYADILVAGKLIVELKCVQHLTNEHIAQSINYLRATNRTLALLVNFQNPKVEWKRVVFNF